MATGEGADGSAEVADAGALEEEGIELGSPGGVLLLRVEQATEEEGV